VGDVIPFRVKKKCEYCGHGWIAVVVERGIVYTKCPNCGRGRFLWSYLDRDYEKLREIERKYHLEGVLDVAVKVTLRYIDDGDVSE
jgi:ribosomal protein S27AE